MLVGYMRVSSELDRQTTDLQCDALLAAGVDSRNLFEDHASGTKDDRPGLAQVLEFNSSTAPGGLPAITRSWVKARSYWASAPNT